MPKEATKPKVSLPLLLSTIRGSRRAIRVFCVVLGSVLEGRCMLNFFQREDG